MLLTAASCEIVYFGDSCPCVLCFVALIYCVYLSWLHTVCSSAHSDPIFEQHYSYHNQAKFLFHWQLLSGKQGPLCCPNSLCDTSMDSWLLFILYFLVCQHRQRNRATSLLPYPQCDCAKWERLKMPLGRWLLIGLSDCNGTAGEQPLVIKMIVVKGAYL